MTKISSSEAAGHLTKWSNASLLGCVYTCRATGVVFSVVNAVLTLRDKFMALETSVGRNTLLPFDDKSEFWLLEPSEFPKGQNIPPFPKALLKIVLPDRSVCFVFPEP